jgi:hypothetical protein
MAAPAQRHTTDPAPMTLLLLEALGALIILVLIVWWTMFSGRPNGEPPSAKGAGETAGDQSEDKK